MLLGIPEDQRSCSKCGGKMKPIGKKFLRHEMQIIPKQIKLLAYYAVTYACDSCEKDTMAPLKTTLLRFERIFCPTNAF